MDFRTTAVGLNFGMFGFRSDSGFFTPVGFQLVLRIKSQELACSGVGKALVGQVGGHVEAFESGGQSLEVYFECEFDGLGGVSECDAVRMVAVVFAWFGFGRHESREDNAG